MQSSRVLDALQWGVPMQAARLAVFFVWGSIAVLSSCQGEGLMLEDPPPPLPPSTCGDDRCEAAAGEDCQTCTADCGECPPSCGDLSCDAGDGESCSTCAIDCGECMDPPPPPPPPPPDPICGDLSCDAGDGESCSTCAIDCGDCCGDGMCTASAGEDCTTCDADCGSCPVCSPIATQIDGDFDTFCARMSNGVVSCLGSFEGAIETFPRVPALILEGSSGEPFKDVERVLVGQVLACAIKDDRSLWCWTVYNSPPFPRDFPYPIEVPDEDGQPLRGVIGGDASYSACAILEDHTAKCWTPILGTFPILDENGVMTDIEEINLPEYSAPFLKKSDGSFWTFDVYAPMMAAQPLLIDDQPAPMFETLQRTTIGSGPTPFGCGLNSDTTLSCWGGNDWGNLGDGTTMSRRNLAPVLESAGGPPFDRVVRFMIDIWTFGCAVRDDGSVWCWGRNAEGELGDDFNALGDRSTVPLRLRTAAGAFLNNAVDVASGSSQTCALTKDGAVWCWGYGTDPHQPHPITLCPE